jgi:hypothetical protein
VGEGNEKINKFKENKLLEERGGWTTLVWRRIFRIFLLKLNLNVI